LLLLLALTQGIAAQRIFGGEERRMTYREGAVHSLSQVMFAFVGKDIASLVEIVLSAAVFTLIFIPIANTFASSFGLFSLGFALLYAVWGMSHIWAIICPANSAALVAVVASFTSFNFIGLKPTPQVVYQSLGKYGAIPLLVSPLRWGYGYYLHLHVTGRGAPYEFVEAVLSKPFNVRGHDIYRRHCPGGKGVVDRWFDGDGWVCHPGQLILLGLLFRFIAAMVLVLTSSAHASGGKLALGTSSIRWSRIMSGCIKIMLAFMFLAAVLVLGQTH